MRRHLAVLSCGVVLTGFVLVGVLRSASADSSSSEAARLVTSMRAAPHAMQFSGMVRVTWLEHGKPNDITVSVADDNGAIEVESGQARVFDIGTRTYFKSRLGWSSALVEPEAEDVPAPDHRWTLRVRHGPTIVGRPTRLIEATRSNGTAAQKLYLDTDTNLLLRRDVLDNRGRVQRSLTFLELTIAAGPTLHAPRGVHTQNAVPLDDVPSGYVAPSTPSGYVLVGRSRHSNGVELLYSDGMFTVSMLEQRGELDMNGNATGGTAVDVGGNDATRYTEPGADVLVWERDGTVFTCVSDAPPDVIDALVGGFMPSRSAAERVADYVLGPFGWS
jgi:hypothetical protein